MASERGGRSRVEPLSTCRTARKKATPTTTKPSRQYGCFPLVSSSLVSDFAMTLEGTEKRRLQAAVEEAKFGLNYMHGEFFRDALVVDPSLGHDAKLLNVRLQTQRHIEGHAFRSLDSSRAIRPREAIQSLLKGRSPYSSLSVSSVAPCKLSSVAFPTDIQDGPFLDEMVPKQVSDTLAGFTQHMLRESNEVANLDAALGQPNAFMDERLSRSPRMYGKFIQQCLKSGLVQLTLKAYAVQGVFFVKKKNGMLRIILDCRRANRYFKEAPPTSLITGEGLGDLEISNQDFIESGLGVIFGCADIDACFHRLKLRGDICHYFCWEAPPNISMCQ